MSASVERGRLLAIWSKRAHRGPMDALERARLLPGKGVEGSVGRSSRRQVTVLARKEWERCTAAVGSAAPPVKRRANLLVEGVDLYDTRGRVLCVGLARIAIGGEVTPCERMEEVHAGLSAPMKIRWGGGAFGQVLEEAEVAVGDAVWWE